MSDAAKILPVLIVGGGPTGLALGAALNKYGVRNRVIEPVLDRAPLTKALAVQAGTLEAIAEMFGPEVSSALIAQGLPARGIELHLQGRKNPVVVDFSLIPSLYNFILMVPQFTTENLLETLLEKYGGQVERGRKLLSFHEEEEFVRCEVEGPGGSREEIRTEYIVGCDGAHSLVRRSSGLSFEGETYQGEFWLGDVEVEGLSSNHEHLQIFMGAEGIAAFFPMGRNTNRYRMMQADAEPGAKDTREQIPLEEFEQGARLRTGLPLKFSNPKWLAPFHLNDRKAPQFRKSRIFLAGDACHIHSPVGGQGMNTGIQDSFSLGYKLAQKILQKRDFLDAYEKERKPVAANVIRFTGLGLRIGLAGRWAWFRALRSVLAPLFLNRRFVQRKIATAVSQVHVARRDIARRKRA